MDNVTHTLFALTLARTPLRRAGRGTTAALVLASNAPDVDVLSLARGGASYMHWHRGPTHGPLGVVGLGLIGAALVWAWPRPNGDERRPPIDDRGLPTASFAMLAAISMLAVALHIAMDLPTSYGTRMLSPFDWHWYAFDWLPIVDIYLLIALAAGLFFGRGSDAAGRRNAAIVLALMAANYGLRGVAHHEALALAPRVFGPTLPAPCAGAPDASSVLDRWPREVRLKADAATARSDAAPTGVLSGFGRSSRCRVEIAAMPTFTSPLDWRLVVQSSNAYDLRDVSLTDARLRGQPSDGEGLWRETVRYPNVWTPAAGAAAATALGQIFLGFSRFPAVRSVSDASGTTVRFIDMRFAAGLVALVQPVQRPSPLSVTIRLAPDGRVVREAFGR